MPTFIAKVEVVHHEVWEVEAADEHEARDKISEMHSDVIEDETGGEVVGWTIRTIKRDRG